MPDPELNIKLSVSLQNLDSSIKLASDRLKEFGRDAKQLGRDLTQLSGDVTRASGAITGLFTAAFASARNDLPAVNQQFQSLGNSMRAMANSVAEAALPTFQQFTQIVNNLAVRIQDFTKNNQQLVNSLLRFSTVSLVLGLMVGVIGQLIKFVSDLARVIGSIIGLFSGWRILIILITAAIAGLIFAFDTFRAQIVQFLARIPLVGQQLASLVAKIPNLTNVVKNFTAQVSGFFSSLVNDTQQAADAIVDPLGRMVQGFKSAFEDIRDSAFQLGQQIGNALEQSLGDTIFNAITGRLQGLRSVLINLGNEVGRFFTRFLANEILGGIFGGENRRGLFDFLGLGGLGGLFRRGGGGGTQPQTRALNQQFEALTDNMRRFGRVKDDLMENFRRLSRTTEDLTRNFSGLGNQQGGGVISGVGNEAQEGIGQLNESLGQTMGLVEGIGQGFSKVTQLIIGVGKTFAIVQLAMLGISIAAGAASFAFLSQLAKALAAAWLPAAILASIATFGAAAVVGLAAVTGALAGGKAILGSFTNDSGGKITFGGGGVENGGAAGFPQIGFGQEGGIVTRPTLAVLGEAGAEAVVPLNRTRGNRPLGGVGGQNVNITINEAILNNPSNMRDFVRLLREEIGRTIE